MWYRELAAALCIILLFASTQGGEALPVVAAEEDVEVYWFFTCHEYEPLNHTPSWISDYFEVTDPEVFLWLNTTHMPGVELTVFWFTPDNETHRTETWTIPVLVETSPWYDKLLEMPIDGAVRAALGEWRADLYMDDLLLGSHTFHLIDKSSED